MQFVGNNQLQKKLEIRNEKISLKIKVIYGDIF